MVKVREMGKHISAYFSLCVLLSNTNFISKLKFKELKKNIFNVQIFHNLTPPFHSEEWLGQLSKRKRIIKQIIKVEPGGPGQSDGFGSSQIPGSGSETLFRRHP